jgi:hypothetical protein
MRAVRVKRVQFVDDSSVARRVLKMYLQILYRTLPDERKRGVREHHASLDPLCVADKAVRVDVFEGARLGEIF